MEDLIVIGAGIVGLATARQALRRHPNWSVLVLDQADGVATEQTGHNSGVIHAGIYYTPGSAKARLCRAGAQATMTFCAEHQIPYRRVGKLLVATDEADLARLAALARRAAANGIDLEHLTAAQLRSREPRIRGLGALYSPSTAIVDFARVARAMAAEITAMGGQVRTECRVRGITERVDGVDVRTTHGVLRSRYLVACAGVQADRVARLGGIEPDFQIVPFRGEYYRLPAARADLVQHLIYPVPDPGLPFLGVHLSPTIDGGVTVGPNAVLSLSRHGYRRATVSPRDVWQYARYPGLWRFAARNLGTGVHELRNSVFRRGYLQQVRRYCPELQVEDLLPHPPGIRAQALLRDGTAVDDFLFRSTARQVHVCNAPSPAATSAIPIGDFICERIGSPDR